jgi:SEC-C motif domain protein
MNRKNTTTALSHCPCGSGSAYSACCGQYLSQSAIPHHAEALMRSRYTAYTLERDDYLLATWHPGTRPDGLDFASGPQRRWLGLTVKCHEQLSVDQATVEFVARFKVGGRAHRLHEISRFVRENRRWFYVDGDMI